MASATVTTTPVRKRYLPTLDGCRAVAIGLVLLQHIAESAGYAGSGFFAALLNKGGFGVQIFFAISGYLITSKLLGEEEKAGRISLGNFYKRRIFRIYPAALAFIFSLGVLRILGIIYLPTRHVIAAVGGFANYVNYVFPGSWTWYLGHFWSLAVEEHFYLIWPGILVVVGSRRRFMSRSFWRWQLRHGGWAGLLRAFKRPARISISGRTSAPTGCFGAASPRSPLAERRGARWLERLAKPILWWPILAIVLCTEFFNPGTPWIWMGGVILAVGLGW